MHSLLDTFAVMDLGATAVALRTGGAQAGVVSVFGDCMSRFI